MGCELVAVSIFRSEHGGPTRCRHEWRHGTQECVRHVQTPISYQLGLRSRLIRLITVIEEGGLPAVKAAPASIGFGAACPAASVRPGEPAAAC